MNAIEIFDGVHVKTWCAELDNKVMEQIANIATLPFAYHHIAVMPDAHLGYGMPIGAVLACDGVVIPNAVGVDIGCGMLASQTNLTEFPVENIKEALTKIRKLIPVGFKKHKHDQIMPDRLHKLGGEILYDQFDNAKKSMGTLGGGNHFIEFQKGSDGFIWIMLHSGSRGVGHTVAKWHWGIAKALNALWHTQVPIPHDLAFLPVDSEEGGDYIADMQYCVDYAKANRHHMMLTIHDVLADIFPIFENTADYDVAHNYAALEHHFDRNVWVHRKGATRAYDEEVGIIPGSQGTASYIVKGKGNRDSFMSCSHGAGRKMGRRDAQRNLMLDKEKEMLDTQGIIHSIRCEKDLDEAAGAYKDIEEVMRSQQDLVEVVVELKPLAVMKG